MSLITESLDSLALSPAQIWANLAMFPLLRSTAFDADYLVLDDDIFKALQGRSSVATGWLRLVTSGHAAQDSNDYLIYNSTSDKLYYDPDGNGSRGAVLVATITMTGTSHPSASDFLVIP